MEMSQGKSLYSYLKQTKKIIFFSFTKLENWRAEPLFWGLIPVGEGRMWGKGVGQSIWYKYCVHMYVNGKIRPVETIPGMGIGEMK
jgi:hypothetical protein